MIDWQHMTDEQVIAAALRMNDLEFADLTSDISLKLRSIVVLEREHREARMELQYRRQRIVGARMNPPKKAGG